MVSENQKLKTYLVEYENKKVRGKKKMLKKLYWYDHEYKVMYTVYGDQLRMRWHKEWKKSIPDVEWDKEEKKWVMKEPVYEVSFNLANNKKEIENWVKNVASRLGVELNREETDSKGIAIDVPSHISSQIEYLLDRNLFRHREL